MSENNIQPNTPYQWQDDAKFELNGKEFEILINTVRAILNTPESQKVLLLARTGEILESILVKGINTGVVTPAPVKEASSEAVVVE